MPLVLTDEQKSELSNKTTDKPHKVDIPPLSKIEEESKAGKTQDQFAEEMKPQMPSGIQQEINAIEISINENKADIEKNAKDIVMENRMLQYYHAIITNYEQELKYTNGNVYSQPWDINQTADAKNIYHNVSSHYYPTGFSNTIIQQLDADNPEKITQAHYSNNLKSRIYIAQKEINYFRSKYSNSVRDDDSYSPRYVYNVVTGTDPETGSTTTTRVQSVNSNYTYYFTDKNRVTAAITNALATLTIVKGILETSPYPDDKDPKAAPAATAHLTNINDYLSRLNSIKSATYYSDSVLSAMPYSYYQQDIRLTLDKRVQEINTFRKEKYYAIRKQNALNLVTMSSGLIFNKYSLQNTLKSNQAQKVEKEEELRVYKLIEEDL